VIATVGSFGAFAGFNLRERRVLIENSLTNNGAET
jgi:hypothetical protein